MGSSHRRGPGLFITVEGVEGSGKTTFTGKLCHRLSSDREGPGLDILKTQEPGSTIVGKLIYQDLLKEKHERIDPVTELLLFVADRREHLLKVVRPALREGRIVICERFSESTLAYQGAGRGLGEKFVSRINRLATERLQPDLTFLLDLPVETGQARINGKSGHLVDYSGRPDAPDLFRRDEPRDRFDAEASEFHERVREEYLRLARKAPKRIQVLDGTKDLGELVERAVEIIAVRLQGRGVKIEESV